MFGDQVLCFRIHVLQPSASGFRLLSSRRRDWPMGLFFGSVLELRSGFLLERYVGIVLNAKEVYERYQTRNDKMLRTSIPFLFVLERMLNSIVFSLYI